MMRRLFFAMVVIIGLSACSKKSKGFSVSVDAPAIGTQQITVIYTTPDGNRRLIRVPSINGEFEFEGSSSSPSIVEIFTSNRRLFAALIAEDGDKIELSASDSGFDVSGSKRSQQLLDYKPGDDLNELSAEVRRAVELVYAEAVAPDTICFPDSIELIMGKNRVKEFGAEGVWVFTSSGNERTSTLLDSLRAYAAGKRPLRDVFVGGDTVVWRMAVRRDSATWTQAMMPDAPIVLNGILRHMPSMIEVDSAGVIIRNQRLE